MKTLIILILTLFHVSECDWVLVPFINSKQNPNGLKSEPEQYPSVLPAEKAKDNFSCPDFHNLTAMSFANSTYDTLQTINDLEISAEDFQRLIKENKKIPKTTPGKTHFMARIGENLMIEAEKRIKKLFHSGKREARFTSFHFPTMEGSLMTISMLLFGVYLSKLIVKLLQSHYTKYNMPIRMMGEIRKPILITQNRRTRSIESDLQQIHFLNLIDEYNYQFH